MIVDAVGKLSSESVTQFVEKERATCSIVRAPSRIVPQKRIPLGAFRSHDVTVRASARSSIKLA